MKNFKKVFTLRNSKGFTLIELLVVVAIIGILASVVLASLNTARGKGADAAVKANLANSRAKAEMFYDANGDSYDRGSTTTDVCDPAGSVGTPAVKGIYENVFAAAKATGLSAVNTAIGTAGTTTTATCHSTAGGWAADAPLKVTTNGALFCADSNGVAMQTNTVLGVNDVTCN
jgi:prepilin-type N-terminal cleavage/methylation domain-containing protein